MPEPAPVARPTHDLPHIDIVGLGPGDDRFVTRHTLDVITSHTQRFVRTNRHPSAQLVGAEAVSFDDVYESESSFADVYLSIADRLVAAAVEHGRLVYAVPGSPLVLERTVRHIRDDPRVVCTVHPALSFLDLAYERLDIDPVETGVRLVDGHQFAVSSAGYAGAMLVAHTHANWVLSEMKLALESADDASATDVAVVILQRLGTADELITHTTWADLDRAVEVDHLTSVYIPAIGIPVGAELVRLHELARVLRERCPWDQKQTHQTLVKYLVEETYEVVDAIEALDPDEPSSDEALIEELGDLLYQIEFHATIAEQQGRFTIADVAKGIHDKLVRRHPHVFGAGDVTDVEEVVANWDAIKRHEKQRTSALDGIPTSQPSLGYAEALQRRAGKVGFDWVNVQGALPKIAEETAELVAAIEGQDSSQVSAELGDLLFAVVNVARHLEIEPESALRGAANKFRGRFEQVEALAARRGIDILQSDLATLDALWDEVKALEPGGMAAPQ